MKLYHYEGGIPGVLFLLHKPCIVEAHGLWLDAGIIHSCGTMYNSETPKRVLVLHNA